MRSLFHVHVLVVLGAALIGLIVGSRFVEPAILGAVLGLGAGLGGGAFAAAIVTGTSLAGGGGGSPMITSIWDDEDTGDPPASNGHPL